jgi:sugar phosphate isomerase/epimerase
LEAGFAKVVYALERVSEAAEKLGVVLALENHGGLPCSGEEQVRVIEKVNSKALRATIDVGNYMQCGEDAVQGTRIAAPYAAYVHFKDFLRDANTDNRYGLRATAVGEGEVDHAGCLSVLSESGYSGYVALEYEGAEDERSGVAKSVEFMHSVMAPYG